MANLRAQQMCIPFLSRVLLGTWGYPAYRTTGLWFCAEGKCDSPGCIGGGRRAGAHSKEEVFRVPQALDTQVGRGALVCTVWQTHTVSLNLVGKHFTVRSAPVFQIQFCYLLSREDLGKVTHLWQGIMHCVWAQWVGWVWGARAAAGADCCFPATKAFPNGTGEVPRPLQLPHSTHFVSLQGPNLGMAF